MAKSTERGGFVNEVVTLAGEVASKTRFSLKTASFVGLLVVAETVKQCSNYGVRYSNGGEYPVPQALHVTFLEVIKLAFTITMAGGKIPPFTVESLFASLPFIVPSLIYVVSNNAYFYGLTLVAPPIWLILVSMKTFVSAVTYKFILRRPISDAQLGGSMLMVLSVAIAKFPDALSARHSETMVNALPVSAIFLASFACIVSVSAGIATEKLFQDKNRSGPKFNFLEQQFWMYFYGSIVNWTAHSLYDSDHDLMSVAFSLLDLRANTVLLLLLALLSHSVGGMVVASILKHLDNVVKEYSYSLANIFCAIICAYVFPDRFEINGFIVLSLILLFTGIYCYEVRGKIKPKHN